MMLLTCYSFLRVLGLPASNISSNGPISIVSSFSQIGEIDSDKFSLCIGNYKSNPDNSGLSVLGSEKNYSYPVEIYLSSLIPILIIGRLTLMVY